MRDSGKRDSTRLRVSSKLQETIEQKSRTLVLFWGFSMGYFEMIRLSVFR
ncbi:hypothetical protein VCHA43P284_440005 [Vibrio chagasii]|nr:hypothetical protein VCHA43P284_440005 [Vibrio chagasii]